MLDNYLPELILYALLIWFLIAYRHRLRTWVTRQMLRRPTLSQKPKRRAARCPFPTKRPDCLLCQKDLRPTLPPEPPAMSPAKRGPKPTVDTRFHFCPNTDCPYYGWLDKANIISNGFPNAGTTRQLKCKACHCFFSETDGTPFYRLQTPPEIIILALKVLAEGLDLQATARVFEVKVRTVQRWLERASQHMDTVSAYLMHDLDVSQVQLDEMWLLLGKRDNDQPEQRKTRWFWSAIDADTKLWLGYLIADRSLEAAQVFVHQVYELLKAGCVPLFLSDGYKPYAIALLTHFGHWVGHVSESGRKLRDRWHPLPQLTYAQVVKRRRRKRLVSVTHRVVYGTLQSVQAKLKVSVGKTINTAFIERLNLMVRQRVPALARRTLAAAKHEIGLEQELNLRSGYYNFVLAHGSLRQRLPKSDDSAEVWQKRTPAMAAGVTDHIWRIDGVRF